LKMTVSRPRLAARSGARTPGFSSSNSLDE